VCRCKRSQKIDKKKYAPVANGTIRSDTLVLTDRQKQHIVDRRGQKFFDTFSPHFKEIAEDPDYIFPDKTHPNTALASKTLSVNGKHTNLVIRLAVEGDASNLENSVITAIIENDKRYAQRLRNNVPLYKRT
jgi:hypothetical protein